MEHRVSYWTGTHRPWHPHSILHRCKLSHHHSRPLATPYHTHIHTHTMTISHKSYITWYHTYTPSITATCTTEQHTLHYAPQYSRTTHNNKPWYTTHHLTTTSSDTSHIQNNPTWIERHETHTHTDNTYRHTCMPTKLCKRWNTNQPPKFNLLASPYLPKSSTFPFHVSEEKKIGKSSTLGIPTWSPTVVLTEPDDA